MALGAPPARDRENGARSGAALLPRCSSHRQRFRTPTGPAARLVFQTGDGQLIHRLHKSAPAGPGQTLAAPPMKSCVIFNPAAHGEKARRFRDRLAALSTECALKPTYAPGGGRALAAEAVREGFETIVAAGGDGTVNEVLNGIGDEPDAFAHTRLGVLPLGTINVFARELKLPTNFDQAWKIIQQGQETAIDLPEAEFAPSGQRQRRFFAQMAGAGLDSRTIELVDWSQKKAFGGLAYAVAGFKVMLSQSPQVLVSDGRETLAGELALIGNGRLYGGRYRLFPRADLRDGLLEASVFPRADWAGLARCGWGLLFNRLYTSGGVRHLRAESLTLESATAMPFHLEGENVGQLPVKFSVRRQALRFIVP